MNNKAKILLLVAGATGLLFMTARKSSAAETEEEEDEETVVPVGPPVQIPRGRTPDDFFGTAPATVDDLLPKAPGEPPKFFPTPPTQGGEPIPPKKAIPEDDEAEESENPAPPPVFTTQPVPTVPRPPPVAVPPQPKAPAEKPTNIPADTAELLRLMLARETTGDWKRQEPALALWQRERDLTADKKFGPQSALTMAEETGLLPIVRFWPKGAQKAQAVEDYQEDLLELASKAEEPRRSQLKAAAEREQGQGFGRNPIPITPTILI